MGAHVTVSPRGEARLRQGHVWIYRSDVLEVRADGGDIVDVSVATPGRGAGRRWLGRAFYSDRSQIAIRLLSRDRVSIDAAFWRGRLAAAVAYRDALAPDSTAVRLVHGESDLLPSLVVDRYAECLVVQALSQGADRVLPELVPLLVEITGATGVLARHDVGVRRLEGLDQDVRLLWGDVPGSIDVREGPVTYDVDVRQGQKTGWFLDQRENRMAAARYAHGRVLDGFCYQGGFALPLARVADDVCAVDASEDAVHALRRHAARNGLSNVRGEVANVFDDLRRRERAGERFDTVVLDPPAFARNKGAVRRAMAGYREINLRALRLLNPGGFLVTCSCSYNIDEATFGQIVHEAALDAKVRVTVVDKRMQGRDHPVLLGVPETYYLKCLILRRVL